MRVVFPELGGPRRSDILEGLIIPLTSSKIVSFLRFPLYIFNCLKRASVMLTMKFVMVGNALLPTWTKVSTFKF